MRRDGSDIQEITNLVTVGGWMAWSPIQERDVTFTGLIFAGMMCIVSIGLRRR
jgi:hypothetical protein